MTDAEHEMQKATEMLVRSLKESGDKKQAIADYYGAVAYWESKGANAPELPDEIVAALKAEEETVFAEHRKNYAANKAAEEKKKEDVYWSKFLWAVGLTAAFFPAYWVHGDTLSNKRQEAAINLIQAHVGSLTGTSEFRSEDPNADYDDEFKKQFPDYYDVFKLGKIQGYTFGSPEVTEKGTYGSYAEVVHVKVPVAPLGELEYTVEDTNSGAKIIGTNEAGLVPKR